MFSDDLKKFDKKPPAAGLAIACGGVFVFLVASLVWVLNGQVERALHRQAQFKAAQAALASCADSYSGAARRQCTDQVNAGLMPDSAHTPMTEILTSASAGQTEVRSASSGPDQGGGASTAGFMPAAFSSQ